MKTFYCRIAQFILKIANYFIPYKTPEVIHEAGCINQVGKIAKKEGFKNVLLVSDAVVSKFPFFKSLTDSLEKENISYHLFTDIQPNPTDINVETGYKIYRENMCQGIISLGGGSPMDCAKGIAAKSAYPNKKIAQLQGILKIHRKTPTIIAIPTTAGTGSETTIAAVITEASTHHKASINDPHLMPKYAVLDPEVTLGLPPRTTAMTGMDALCHAVEAYTNATYCTALENELAIKAVKLIYGNILEVYNNGQNVKARADVQLAAFYAGRAFTRGCVGYVHAVGHTVSGLYNLPHGWTMAIILPYVLRQFGSAVYRKLAVLARACGIEGTDEQCSIRFIEWIEQTNAAMGIDNHIDVIDEKDIEQMIEWADKEANPIYPVPRIFDHNDFEKLIRTVKG